MSDTFELNDSTFKSFQVTVSFQNLVSKTTLPSSAGIKLFQLGDHSLFLELPARACAKGHNAMLSVFETSLNPNPEKPLLQATAKVLNVESLEEGRMYAEMELIQFDEEEWKQLEALFDSRQQEITKFMDSTKD